MIRKYRYLLTAAAVVGAVRFRRPAESRRQFNHSFLILVQFAELSAEAEAEYDCRNEQDDGGEIGPKFKMSHVILPCLSV